MNEKDAKNEPKNTFTKFFKLNTMPRNWWGPNIPHVMVSVLPLFPLPFSLAVCDFFIHSDSHFFSLYQSITTYTHIRARARAHILFPSSCLLLLLLEVHLFFRVHFIIFLTIHIYLCVCETQWNVGHFTDIHMWYTATTDYLMPYKRKYFALMHRCT